MKATEAADKIRDTFHLEAIPPEDHRFAKFVVQVADELGVDHTPFNLQQVAAALHAQSIKPDAADYPKMLYCKTRPAGQFDGQSAIHGHVPITYDIRHGHWFAHVESEDQAKRLGKGWVDTPDAPESDDEEHEHG